ncbi:hypothetical protein TrRE_jg9921 [Triparma retinervis]|uniref:MPN domain-containing protein n=1 Tax=Triparma retinervis TaxID=2557542 RepID=A0A9W6ZJB6_9STRA|nr:hypothetical protein TrRE_jg9921 [Triparma retinervis]
MEALTTQTGPTGPQTVVVHPLVLLSAVDHYNRVAKDTKKRVVGVLLGSTHRGTVDVTNSFAVPFEEDSKNKDVWFLDHNYLENMFNMFRKVAAKERIVGFYSSGPKIRPNDLAIESLMRKFCPSPVFVVIDVRPNQDEIPTTAYRAVEEVEGDGKEIQRTFQHLPSSIGAMEAEEVGVEHLLRDINDPTTTTIANQLKDMQKYLQAVLDGSKVPNQQILYDMQTMFNLLPNLNVPALASALIVKSNDMHLVVYLASLCRSVIALHELVSNRIQHQEGGQEEEEKKEEPKEEKKDAVKAN